LTVSDSHIALLANKGMGVAMYNRRLFSFLKNIFKQTTTIAAVVARMARISRARADSNALAENKVNK
jgi:hypothetical protein